MSRSWFCPFHERSRGVNKDTPLLLLADLLVSGLDMKLDTNRGESQSKKNVVPRNGKTLKRAIEPMSEAKKGENAMRRNLQTERAQASTSTASGAQCSSSQYSCVHHLFHQSKLGDFVRLQGRSVPTFSRGCEEPEDPGDRADIPDMRHRIWPLYPLCPSEPPDADGPSKLPFRCGRRVEQKSLWTDRAA